MKTLIESLTPRQRDWLYLRLREHGRDDDRIPVERAPGQREFPVSFGQQRLWFLERLNPGATFFNVPAAMRMKGTLDVGALRRTLAAVIRRHEILRTTFGSREGRPVQIVAPELDLELPIVDCEAPTRDREAWVRSEIEREASTPFCLERGPLLRAKLLRLAADEHVVILDMHHIVSDMWSAGVLIREVAALYGSMVEGRGVELAPLEVQYADYAQWQRGWMQGERLEKELSYWTERMRGVETLELPVDHPRPPVPSYRGGQHRFTLSRELTSALKRFAGTQDATQYMALLGGFKALLHRHTGQSDVCVGTPVANRSRSQLESLIGFFVNTLALRTEVRGEQSFTEIVGAVRETSLGAFAHQDLPFDQLVEALQPERDMSRAPLFQVMFVLQNAPMGELSLPGLALEAVPFDLHTTDFDLTLKITEAAGELRCTFEYSADLFERATVERWAGHFERLLTAAVAAPERPIASLDLLGEDERSQVLVEFNDTARRLEPAGTVIDWIETQAARTPDAPAVEYEGETLSYAQLDTQANRLARHLQGLGVGPDVAVGVCMDRSVELVVSLLAVLKAGGAYLPIDPAYPADRVAYVVGDARVSVVLAQRATADRLPAGTAHVVAVDDASAGWRSEPSTRPLRAQGSDSRAYVIYTSGSTGRPKGVSNTQAGLHNRIAWMQETFPLDASDAVLQKTPFTFDVSVWEFFWPLMVGARLVVARPDGHKDSAYLVELIQQRGVTTVHFVPSMLQVFVDDPAATGCSSLRRVFSSGEALPFELQERFFACLGAELHNLYGPTEAAIDVTHWACTRGSSSRVVPIGRPIANTQVYVLDAHLEPVPLGVPGDLYLAGIQLARGYVDASLTSERFIANPHGPSGSRMYTTGDRARWRADGAVEYLGRSDHQIKLRGFRIELGEIETALGTHPGVKTAVVVVRDDGKDRRLVAYLLACAADAPPAAPELREHLRALLPEYMVPATFVTLEALPLTSSGKVDRKALPAPGLEEASSSQSFTAPRSPTEQALADIWSDVLGAPRVGVLDSFFDLGGHSLRVMQVIARVRAELRVDVTVREFFERPTVARLADLVATRGTHEDEPALVATDRTEPAPLSFAQQRLWFLDQLGEGSAFYNVPGAVRLHGPLDVAALRHAFQQVVRRHEILRARFPGIDGSPVLAISPEGPFDLPVLEGPGDPDAAEAWMRREVRREALAPFSLENGPLFRATLLRLRADVHVAVLNMHHVVSDGWSLGILIQEIARLYAAARAGEPDPLPALRIQYADFARWQRAWLQGPRLSRQLSYWRERMKSLPEALDLPADRPRPAMQTYAGAQHWFTLSADLAQKLRALGQSRGATLFMTLLAGFEVLLHRYTGQTDLCVGTPVANRGRPDLEPLIGLFVNTLALRTQVSGGLTFVELLDRVRETSLEAFAHQDLPFEQLVEAVQPERDTSRTPLFQVMFALQNAPATELRLPDLVLEPLTVETQTSKLDLTLEVTEDGGELRCNFEYNTDLFDEATIGRVAAHLERLLCAVASDAERPIASLDMFDATERGDLLTAALGPEVQIPAGVTVVDLLEEQVARTPDAVALVSESGRLTYAELDSRANQLAHRLRREGVRPESLVVLATGRSSLAVVALFGVLKAGGAYVPVDPSYPRDRILHTLADSRPALVLTDRASLAAFVGCGVPCLCVDAEEAGLASEPTSPPLRTAAPENAAYVIYTSGSTGWPKGTVVTHRSVVNMVAAHRRDLYAVRPARPLRATLAAPLVFDASVSELAALFEGHMLFVVPDDVRRSPEDLARYLRQHSIDVFESSPAQLKALVQAAGIGSLPPFVLCGGEAIDASLWSDLQSAPSTIAFDVYGPTECTVDVACCRIDASVPEPRIGRAEANVEAHVLDGNLELVPRGVAGELYVGGPSVARCYLNRPDLTADRFVPDPFSGRPGARLYRTGDLVRRDEQGRLAYVGRVDRQVKLRGFRIELAEIESALRSCEDVEDAVVLPLDDDPGGRRLVAFVVAREGHAIAELRSLLGRRLPGHMVPAAFVAVQSFPVTPSGKVDRKALAALAVPRDDGARDVAPPRDEVERAIAAVFSEVTGVPRVGIHDGFFALGGHSLMVMQVVARIRAMLGVEVSVREVFELGTVARLAECIARRDREAGEHALVAMPRNGPVPASHAQQRLWFLDQLDPGSTLYGIPGALRIRGDLDARVLERALNEVVARHEVLRTTFSLEAGRPVQLVATSAHLELPVVSCPVAAPGSEAWVRSEIEREAATPFCLERGPLLRAKLLRLAADEHVLFLDTHHIVSDGWSFGVLVRETTSLYESLRAGRGVELAPLEVQYADYAQWQRGWMQGERLEKQLSYWTERMRGVETLELPADHPRPPVPSYRGGQHRFTLSRELTSALKRFAGTQDATLYMALLGGFKALLHRHTGQSDVCVGTPVANRSRSQLESLIGFFVNTLALRTEVRGEQSFTEIVGAVRETSLGAFAHRDLPFDQLVEALQPERDMSRAPLFQVMFVLQNAPMGELSLPGLALESIPVDPGTSKFDLTLDATEAAGELRCTFEYSADLFERATVERWAGHFERLLTAAVAAPERPIASLDLLGEDERSQVLVEFNDTARRLEPAGTVIDWIETQAARTPDAPAVEYEGETLSYAQLDTQANRLARHLQGLGVGPDVAVGVCMDRSVELVVSLLAVLKAGGAYLPIDPAYPADRVAYVVGDARVSVVLAQRATADRLPAGTAHVVAVDDASAGWRSEPSTRPLRAQGSDSRAYVIYTSGSTGRPKGVSNTQAGLHNRIAWMQETFPLDASDAVLQKTPFTFDVSVWEFFWPLMVGARLVVARPDGHKDSAYLAELVQQRGVTTVHFVPSMLQVFVDDPAATGCSSLRRVFSSGEALPFELQERFFACLGAELHNLYGPTEAAIDVTHWACTRGSSSRVVPIGRPIANTQVYVLDAHLEPVPVGVPGDLYLAGIQLARGYVDASLTSERFIANPHGPSGSRMYKTGDRARWRADGAVEYLGRSDHQIKLRGFRIELGEIETALGTHPGVKTAVVVVRDDGKDRRLVAYLLACAADAPPAAPELREHLRALLPEYMVPATFVTLEALPLTSSGKVDRKALPAPGLEEASSSQSFTAPRSPTEQALADIWSDVLGAPRVGVLDSFFDLGGHSLLLVSVLARIREGFGVQLTIRKLLENTTIASLAAVVDSARGAAVTEGAPASSPSRHPCVVPLSEGSGPPLFCVHPAGGDVLCFANLARHLPGRPVLGLQSPGLAGEREPFTRIEDMAAHFVAAMRAVQPEGPYDVVGWSLGAQVAFDIGRQLLESGQTLGVLALLDGDPAAKEEARREFPTPRSFDDHAPWLANMAEYVGRVWGQPVNLPRELLATLDPEAQIEAFVRALRDADVPGAPPPSATLVRRMLHVFKANTRALVEYTPRMHRGELVLVQAEGSASWADGARHAWTALSARPPVLRTVPGDHHTLLAEPHVRTLAEVLRGLLHDVARAA